MKLETIFSPRIQSLFVQYAFLIVLRSFWAWLFLGADIVPGTVRSALPNPLQAVDDILWFVGFLPRALFGNGYLNYFPVMLFNIAQIAIVLLIGREIFSQYKAASDNAATTAVTRELDGARLTHPWWRVPLLMAFATLLTVSFVVGIVGSLFMGTHAGQALYMAGSWPLWISLALSALGFLWGHRFNASAREIVTKYFGAQLLPENHELTRRVHWLADRLSLPHPAVGYVQQTNAFAVGSNPKDAAVVIGLPLLKHMTQQELDAVIGHELGHIVSNDMQQMQFAQGYQQMFGDVFTFIAQLATLAAASASKTRSSATLAQAAGDSIKQLGGTIIFLGGELLCKRLSRKREFYADAIGAGLTSPEAMSAALDKITAISSGLTPKENRYAYLMFGGGQSRFRPFATHPSMDVRKEALAKGTYVKGLPRGRG